MKYIIIATDAVGLDLGRAYTSNLEVCKKFGECIQSKQACKVVVEVWSQGPIPEGNQLTWSQFLEYYGRQKNASSK